MSQLTKEDSKYQKTIIASFIGYIVQAIVNNFLPLLFVQMQSEFSIPLEQITLLITINFAVQLTIDITSPLFVDKIGYRASMLLSNVMAISGLVLLTILPNIIPIPFIGILIPVIIYAIGGGLLEVIVSPIVESCPTKHKEKAMSLLHSFYCWGHVGVVLLSTLFFYFFNIENWRILAYLWCIIPIIEFILFLFVPLANIEEQSQESSSSNAKNLLINPTFWILFVMMFCAGASEQSVSQWASTFAEQGLGVSKTMGDLLGPLSFAICMGISRLLYGIIGNKIDLRKFLWISVALCIISYIMLAFIPIPVVALLGCGLCGFSVGIFWPGTFSTATKALGSSTLLFALLAVAGDLGCMGGPTLTGLVSSSSDQNMRLGIGISIIFPILLAVCLFLTRSKDKKQNS